MSFFHAKCFEISEQPVPHRGRSLIRAWNHPQCGRWAAVSFGDRIRADCRWNSRLVRLAGTPSIVSLRRSYWRLYRAQERKRVQRPGLGSIPHARWQALPPLAGTRTHAHPGTTAGRRPEPLRRARSRRADLRVARWYGHCPAPSARERRPSWPSQFPLTDRAQPAPRQ